MPGKVYIMGVGPGDYKLITLKAIESLAKADVVVYDRLVSEKILGFARKDAEFIYVGKMPNCHAVPQEGINQILVEKALEGKVVARVKGGDPFVFGRGGEEGESLRACDIEFEIIPGVTSAIAVPAYSGIPVTHRDFCSSFHIITGHERPEKEESSIDFNHLAKVSGTLVFLMGVKNLADICRNLIQQGRKKETPAAVIENGTTKEQRTIVGTLENIAEKAAEAGVKSPAITVVGDVVSLREKLNWFPRGRLSGKKIIVTRAREQASALVEKIEELGGEAIEFPTIRIEKPDDYTQVDAALDRIEKYNWLVFTSVNGVAAFFDRMKNQKIDVRRLHSVKLCAIGDATEKELNHRGLNVDLVPDRFTSAELLKSMLEVVKPGEKVLLARTDIATGELTNGLKQKGIEFEEIIVYKTVPVCANGQDIIKMMNAKKVDYITFTSSSTVKNFVSAIGRNHIDKVASIHIVCIGPVTAETAQELGLKVHAVADTHTIDGVVEKLI